MSSEQLNNNKNQIKQIVKDMCNVDYLVGKKHMHDSSVFVRPSGNPLDLNGWDKMMNNEDVSVESNDLLSINKLHVNGNMGYVCFTSHGKFRYKGTYNDDVAVLTYILEKIDDKWKIVWGQRSTGRKPDEDPPNFNL
jgi:hypothetical protein